MSWTTILLCLVTFIYLAPSIAAVKSLKMKVLNEAGKPIELFWVNSFKPTRDLVVQTKKPLRNNSDASINTYASHQFTARWLKHIPGTEVNFTMGPKDQTFIVRYNTDIDQLYVEQEDESTKLRRTVQAATKVCEQHLLYNATEYKSCITEQMVDEVRRIKDNMKRMDGFRNQMSERLRNYTCLDDAMQTTEAVSNYTYHFLDKSYFVQVMLDDDNAKIWMIEDFATEEECDTLMETARPNLMKATVAAEDGSSTFSEARKAQQAGYEFKNGDYRADSLWPLYDRIIKHVNYHSKLSVRPDGQEGFTIIQYNPGDEYIWHCDGTCDGSNFIPGARVATSVLYCKTPEKGGATTFSKANIFVKPKKLAATFFSYKSTNGQFDTGLTEHSGCPVREGEKWIAASWLREGVTKERNWENYDPSGIPMVDYDADISVEDGGERSIAVDSSAHDEL